MNNMDVSSSQLEPNLSTNHHQIVIKKEIETHDAESNEGPDSNNIPVQDAVDSTSDAEFSTDFVLKKETDAFDIKLEPESDADDDEPVPSKRRRESDTSNTSPTKPTSNEAPFKQMMDFGTKNNYGKRWTQVDKCFLLQQMISTKARFEKPSAMRFYSKIIAENPNLQEYSWKSCRDKIRQLKKNYFKAIEWMNSMGSDDAELDEYVTKLCPDFQALSHIFGTRSEVNQQSSSVATVDMNENQERKVQPVREEERVNSSMRNLSSSDAISILSELEKKRQEHYYSERLKLKKEELRQKRVFEEAKLALEKEKMKIERERLVGELKVKLLEVENNFKLKEMELKLKYNKKE